MVARSVPRIPAKIPLVSPDCDAATIEARPKTPNIRNSGEPKSTASRFSTGRAMSSPMPPISPPNGEAVAEIEIAVVASPVRAIG